MVTADTLTIADLSTITIDSGGHITAYVRKSDARVGSALVNTNTVGG